MMKFQPQKILRYLPLLAPIPEAYAVGLAIQRELNWHVSVIVIASFIVAGTGFWGVQVFNRMNDFNATLYGAERNLKLQVPTWQAGVILGVWFAGVTALTVFLEAVPVLHVWTPVGLVVIGFSAAYLYSLSNLCATREQERLSHRQKVDEEKQVARNQRKEERKAEKERAQELANIRQKITANLQGRQGPRHVKRGAKLSDELLLLYWGQNPYLTSYEMAETLVKNGEVPSITRQAVDGRKKEMIKRGLIVVNPDGMVVTYLQTGRTEGQGSVSLPRTEANGAD